MLAGSRGDVYTKKEDEENNNERKINAAGGKLPKVGKIRRKINIIG